MFLSRAGVPWRRNYNPPEYAPAAAPACEFNRLVKTLDRAIQQNRFSERRLLFQGVRNLVVVSGQRPDRQIDSAESPEIARKPPNHRPPAFFYDRASAENWRGGRSISAGFFWATRGVMRARHLVGQAGARLCHYRGSPIVRADCTDSLTVSITCTSTDITIYCCSQLDTLDNRGSGAEPSSS